MKIENREFTGRSESVRKPSLPRWATGRGAGVVGTGQGMASATNKAA